MRAISLLGLAGAGRMGENGPWAAPLDGWARTQTKTDRVGENPGRPAEFVMFQTKTNRVWQQPESDFVFFVDVCEFSSWSLLTQTLETVDKHNYLIYYLITLFNIYYLLTLTYYFLLLTFN